MLHVVLNVVKVDRDVAHVAMTIHVYVLNISSVPSYVRCKCVYLDVIYVSHLCCKCFILMLHIFDNGFSCVFRSFASVSDACFKCFI
jgi:hypothetical protein